MDYLSQSDQAHLARTCHSLHTATLPHRCSSHIQLFPADRIVSSFLAFLRLNTLGESRAPLINKLYIAITTSGPVVDWQTALTRPTPGYRASFPWITDSILDILAHCTNLGTLSINSWSARLPADRLCNTIAALDSLEDLHLAVTSDRLWAATTAFARLPRLRRLALHLAVNPGFSIDFVPIDPAPLPLVATFSPQTLTELRLSYDRAASMDACLPSVRRLHLTLTAQRGPENVLPTLAHAFPNLTSLTYGTRGWLALDERTAAQWRGTNRAWAKDGGRLAWPQLNVLGGLDVRDLWVLGLAHKVPHVCVAEADPFLGARRPGQSRSGPEAAAWVRRMRRMLPAVLADARPTHLELAATWHLEAHWGDISKNGNSVETLGALRECGGAPGASVTHLIVNVPAPEVRGAYDYIG
ncbi:hypothetical protein K466DRAFT_585639 [Polyporus arcularius HHB13444]|uniref:F-box domain-containing protein n=1 Tax=Polyporus arcularius HHB13444 TaxID=1314778 RepID=A0A5C3PF13_9APHY|nr:hypothetical protein K466DRAFT_585639 [Polyporus arcularius HHB13444]